MKYKLIPQPIEEPMPEPVDYLVAAEGECPQCKHVSTHMIYEPWEGSIGVHLQCPMPGCSYRWMADVKEDS